MTSPSENRFGAEQEGKIYFSKIGGLRIELCRDSRIRIVIVYILNEGQDIEIKIWAIKDRKIPIPATCVWETRWHRVESENQSSRTKHCRVGGWVRKKAQNPGKIKQERWELLLYF